MNKSSTELRYARTMEHAFRAALWLIRFGGDPKADDLPEILFSKRFGFVCAAIPLCGTRALKNFFRLNSIVQYEALLRRTSIPDVLLSGGFSAPPLIFSVVRDPWSRVVSCYEKKIRGAYIQTSYKDAKPMKIIAGHTGLSTKMSFDEFVDWLCSDRGRDDIADRHWISQHRFLSLSQIDINNITILRLQSLQKDLNSLLLSLGLPYQPLQTSNSSATTVSGRLHAKTEDYYTARTIAAVGSRYKRDVELFGFHFQR